jgi:hypothetical protein
LSICTAEILHCPCLRWVIRYRLIRAEDRSMTAMLRKRTQSQSIGTCRDGQQRAPAPQQMRCSILRKTATDQTFSKSNRGTKFYDEHDSHCSLDQLGPGWPAQIHKSKVWPPRRFGWATVDFQASPMPSPPRQRTRVRRPRGEIV